MSQILQIRVVFFDVGGTLLVPARSVGETYGAAARRRGLFADAEALTAAFRAAFREKRRADPREDRTWWRDVVRRTFAAVGETRDVDDLFDEVFEAFARPDAWRLVEGAANVPAALRERGYRTGAITNSDERLPALMAAFGLTPGLDPVIVSGDVGFAKPDPRIYRAAADRAGAAPGEALMVGDERELDVEGARAAGLSAVLYDPAGEGGRDSIRRLTDLLTVLPDRPPPP